MLIAGHYDAVPAAQIFDPTTEEFTSTGAPMVTGRRFAAHALLGSGKVVFAGGSTTTEPLDSVEYYDPEADAFLPADGVLMSARSLLLGLPCATGA